MKKIIVIVAIVLVVGVGGGVAAWLMMSKHPAKNGHKPTEAVEEPAEAEGQKPIYENLGRQVINVDGDQEHRGVVSVEIQVELADAKVKEKLEAYKPRIQSDIILLIGSQKMSDISTPAGKEKLLVLLRDKINEIIGASSPKKGIKLVVFSALILEDR